MKRHRKSLILLSILLFTFIFGFFSVNGVGISEDLEFNFVDDLLYNYPDDSYKNETFNLKTPEEYNGHYPATYSFENQELGDEGLKIGFLSNYVHLAGNINITDFNGHSKVIVYNRNSTDDSLLGYNSFENQTSGIIEFWWAVPQNDKRVIIHIGVSVSSSIYLQFVNDGNIKYYDGTYHNLTIGYEINQWYHFKIEFNLTTGDPSTNWWKCWINNEYIGQFIDGFNGDPTYINKFYVYGYDVSYSYYIDAIGYSWANYMGNHFNTTTEANDIYDIAWDGDSFWIQDEDNYEIYNYNSNGTYSGNSFDISNEITSGNTRGMCWNGTSFWINGLSYSWNYDSEGIYTGNSFDISNTVIPLGMCWDGNSFWIVDSSIADMHIDEYNTNGIYQGRFTVESETWIANSVSWDGTFFWVMDAFGEFFQYNSEGIYTGISFNTNSTTDLPQSFTFIDTNYFWITDRTGDEVYEFYLYNVGDNMFPELEDTQESILDYEIDLTEFAFESGNDLYDVGDDNPSGWLDTEESGDHANIGADLYGDSYDRAVKMEVDGSTPYYTGIEKDFYIEDGVINVSWVVEFTDTTIQTGSYFEVSIYSYDDTLITQIGLNISADAFYYELYQYNGSSDVVLSGLVDSGINDDQKLEFRLFIDSFCILSFWNEDVFNETFYFEKIDPAKDGLGKINFKMDGNGDAGFNFICYLDSVGVYVGGTSLSEDYGYHLQGLEKLDYYSWYINNLFYIKANKEITILATSFDDYYPEYHTESICGRTDLSEGFMINTGENEYVWGWGQDIFLDGAIIIFSNEKFNISEINISGLYLEIDSVHLNPVYESSNVNINNSYFIVHNETNKLSFTLECDDNEGESIRVGFELFEYYQAENLSLRFSSNINGFSTGYVGLTNMDNTSSLFELPTHVTTTNIIIPQDKTFWELSILITDNDKTNSDICTGYVQNISLIIYGGITVSIATLSLFAILIPLIILLVPTFAMYQKFGEQAIVPMIVLMSIVCFIADLIPIGVFFILMICSGVLLLGKKTVEVGF